MALTTHLHLVVKLRKSRAIPLLPLWTFIACYRLKCTFLPTLEDKALCSFETSVNSKLPVTQHNIPRDQGLQVSVQFIGPACFHFSGVFLYLSILNSNPFVCTFPRSLHFVILLLNIDLLGSHCYIYLYLA